MLPLLLSSHPRRRSPEGGLDVVEELAERLLRGERAGHGIVTVVHRCVVLVQQEQQADLIGVGGTWGYKSQKKCIHGYKWQVLAKYYMLAIICYDCNDINVCTKTVKIVLSDSCVYVLTSL